MSLLSTITNHFTKKQHNTSTSYQNNRYQYSVIKIPSEYELLTSKSVTELVKIIKTIYHAYEQKKNLELRMTSSVPRWCTKAYDTLLMNKDISSQVQSEMKQFIQTHEANVAASKVLLTDFLVFVIQKTNQTTINHHIQFNGSLTSQARQDIILQIPHSFNQDDKYTIKRTYVDPKDNKNSSLKYIPQKYVALFDLIYSYPVFEIEQIESNIRALKRLFR